MGGVAVLHPQDYLNDNHNNLFHTPMKSRRNPNKSTPNLSTSTPNLPRSDARKRSPPTGVRKHKSPATMTTDPPVTAAGKHLVMGQVKILKRGEPLDQSSTVVKETNVMTSRTVEHDVTGDKKVTPVKSVKKKAEKERRSCSKVNNISEGLRNDDFALSSTDRLGPDPEMVPKKMNNNNNNNNNNNIAEFFFAGSAFVDSPPPSSVPLPGFFTKSFAVKDDASTDLRRLLGLSLS